jgi:hypothetical protein
MMGGDNKSGQMRGGAGRKESSGDEHDDSFEGKGGHQQEQDSRRDQEFRGSQGAHGGFTRNPKLPKVAEVRESEIYKL